MMWLVRARRLLAGLVLPSALAELCTPADRDVFVGFFADRAPRFLGGPKCIRGRTPISLRRNGS